MEKIVKDKKWEKEARINWKLTIEDTQRSLENCQNKVAELKEQLKRKTLELDNCKFQLNQVKRAYQEFLKG